MPGPSQPRHKCTPPPPPPPPPPLSLRRAPSKQLAGAVCFFFSAVFHELIIGLPLRGVRVPLAFVAMMAQAPPAHQP